MGNVSQDVVALYELDLVAPVRRQVSFRHVGAKASTGSIGSARRIHVSYIKKLQCLVGLLGSSGPRKPKENSVAKLCNATVPPFGLEVYSAH